MTIRVGLVGASLNRAAPAWAIRAHVPAIGAVDEVELYAVATTRIETAREAARELGVEHAYEGTAALAADPDVDLVVACVNVQRHAEVLRPALAAGKHVLSEWPLGLDTAEAEELAALAEEAGVVAAVGLQARFAPAIRRARELVEEGFSGELRSATLVISSPFPGRAVVPAWMRDQASRQGGITVLTIPGGHALDALCFCAGELQSVSAEVATLEPQLTLDTGEVLERTADDHVALAGRLRGGAVVAVQMQGGSSAAIGSSLELRGTGGVVRVTTATPTQLQMSSHHLYGAREGEELERLEIPERLHEGVSESLRGGDSENLAHLYRGVAAAITGAPGQRPVDFHLAASRHRLLDTIERASATGTRQAVPPHLAHEQADG